MADFDSRGNPILGWESTGGEVEWLKQTLGYWGINAGTGNRFDADAMGGVTALQARYGIPQTGYMDETTWGLVDRLVKGESVPRFGDPGTGPMPTGDFVTRPGLANPGTTPPTTPSATANGSALARVTAILRSYGLESMAEWVKAKLIGGASEAEITLDLYDQPEFQKRFPVIKQRQQAGLTPVNAEQVLQYETTARELFRRAGITGTALTSSDYIQSMMGKDVSAAELNDRLQDGLLKVTTAPAEVRVAFGNYFGTTGDAALAQFFLDPEKAAPELEKMAASAYAGGIGAHFNVMLTAGMAREIADTGVSDASIWQGFANISNMRALFEETIGETGQDYTAEGEGVGSVFNTQAGAQERLEQRRTGRVNQFKGGGGAAQEREGVVGLGVADA